VVGTLLRLQGNTAQSTSTRQVCAQTRGTCAARTPTLLRCTRAPRPLHTHPALAATASHTTHHIHHERVAWVGLRQQLPHSNQHLAEVPRGAPAALRVGKGRRAGTREGGQGGLCCGGGGGGGLDLCGSGFDCACQCTQARRTTHAPWGAC
jgi:hypothetical protein